MARQMCFKCSGSGKMQCPICHGKGSTSRLNYNMEVEITPCNPTMSCDACGATGWIGTATGGIVNPGLITEPGPPRAATTTLAGKWQGPDGSIYEFTGSGRDFRLRIASPIGDATGSIRLEGRRGQLSVVMPMLGTIMCGLEIADDYRSLTITTMGVPSRFRRV
jgi:hypothetical protein